MGRKLYIIIICEFTLSLSIATNSYLLTFQNENRRFNSASQYTKTSRPDRPPFTIGTVAQSKNKNSYNFRNNEQAGISFTPGSTTSKMENKIKQLGPSGSGRPVILFPTMMPSRINGPSKPPSGISPSTGLFDFSCEIENVQVIFKNKCQKLLTEEPCSTGYWLLLSKDGLPYCDRKPCKSEEVLYNGKCVNISDTSVCGIFEILYIEFTGEVYCDCFQHYVFDSSVNKCFAPQEQGSCPLGMYLVLDLNNNVVCVKNPCESADLVKNFKDGECYKKLYKGLCREENHYQILFQENKTAVCVRVDNRNIFEVPALTSCPAGSKRDHLNQCQRVLRLDSPFSHRVPTQQVSRYSQCPPNTIRYPDGSCRTINSLLGR